MFSQVVFQVRLQVQVVVNAPQIQRLLALRVLVVMFGQVLVESVLLVGLSLFGGDRVDHHLVAERVQQVSGNLEGGSHPRVSYGQSGLGQ